MRDLGTLPGDLLSWANNINSQHQIVGTSFPPGSSSAPRGFIWQNGRMTDLNLVVGRHPPIYLAEAFGINDRGWIVGWGILPNGNTSSYVLYPCGDGNTMKFNGEGCDVPDIIQGGPKAFKTRPIVWASMRSFRPRNSFDFLVEDSKALCVRIALAGQTS